MENGQPEMPSIDQMVKMVATQTAELVKVLAPEVDPALSAKLCLQAAYEQVAQIPEEILPSLSGEGASDYPIFFARVKKKGLPDAVVKAPKKGEENDTGVAAQSASILALVFTPASRVLLRAKGYTIEFGQARGENPSRIVSPH